MKIKQFTQILALILLTVGVSNAQKFGFINTQALIQEIPEVKEANSNLETYKAQLQKKGQEMIVALQKKYQDLERKQANGEIAPKQLEVEASKLKEEEAKIGQFEQTSQQQIITKSEQLLKPLRDKIQKAIDDVAAEGGFTYIFDASLGTILYADDSTDVSSLVRAKLGM